MGQIVNNVRRGIGNDKPNFLIIFGFLFLVTIPVFAQQIPSLPNLEALDRSISTLLPQPIQDILGIAKQISEKLQNSPIFVGIANRTGEGNFQPESIFSDLKKLWDGINNWFTKNIGVSIKDIIQVIANLILWILEFVINLIKTGLGYVTNL